MSMELRASDLVALADALEMLEKTGGVEVSQFKCRGHNVIVERTEGPRGGSPGYIVRGITTGVLRGATPTRE